MTWTSYYYSLQDLQFLTMLFRVNVLTEYTCTRVLLQSVCVYVCYGVCSVNLWVAFEQILSLHREKEQTKLQWCSYQNG